MQNGQSVTVPNLSNYTLFLVTDSKGDTELGYKSDGSVIQTSLWLMRDMSKLRIVLRSESTYAYSDFCNFNFLALQYPR